MRVGESTLSRADARAGAPSTEVGEMTPGDDPERMTFEELTWLAECAEAPSRQESELAWFAKHFYRVLTQLPEWADALRVRR